MENPLVNGNIAKSLVRFALPVLFALLLQFLYGAIDLLIVGRFAETADISGVATGSLLMHMITTSITALSMGVTVLVGRRIGEGEPLLAGRAVGGGIFLFAVITLILTTALVTLAMPLASLLKAPPEAFSQTGAYIRICGAGSAFIVGYNLLGAIFRGLGDSKTPLITVAMAAVINIGLDLFFVAVLHKGAAGAALATIIAQGASVLISFLFIKHRKQPFVFSVKMIKSDGPVIKTELKIGTPVFLQEALVGISFIIIQAIANTLGVTASAGVGIAEKMCGFLMLVPSSYMQSLSAFVAQNMGAKKPERARKALKISIISSFLFGILMSYLAFFQGDFISGLFTGDMGVVEAGHEYLKAYAIDCLLTPYLFCFIGFFNGCERTFFVMMQGIIGAFVRVPVAFIMSQLPGSSLFLIGLATPCSTIVQITLCMIVYKRISSRLT